MSFRLWHVPVRAAAGAYILNAGLTKRETSPEAAAGLHGFASSAFPQVAEVPPERFVSGLSMAEIGVGALLLTPVVPTGLAGLVLTGFSGLYLKAPGMTQEDGVRPSDQGIPVTKDVWLLGIGLALVLDSLTPGGRRARRKGKKKG